MNDDLAVARHDGEGLRAQQDDILAVYREAYAERLDDPFFYPERFWERIERGSYREGFRLVTGRVQSELVGFTLGSVLPADTAWWRGFKGTPDLDLVRETGSRTFGINELQVRPAWRRRGYAKAMSEALLADLPVKRVTLLVRAENIPAYTAYLSWGFQVVGQMQPFDDSPLYEAMVKEL
ncbi:GNAT family N-acetyltransferase [Actinophytocola sp.]|uniref:GNAT family N-acetyltransferase n=1 Tax=Actinophytocola sp. TaxID=1872138 RepID=UPI003899A8F6